MGTVYRRQGNITLDCISELWLRSLGLRDTYEMHFHLGEKLIIIGSDDVRDLPSVVQQIIVSADAV